MVAEREAYAARLEIDYPEGDLDRVTTFFRIIWAIPIIIILALVSASIGNGLGVSGGFFLATLLLILFRQVYPRWWFDFIRELTRFESRAVAYLLLLTDKYPSTEDAQSVHIEIDYPDAKQDLNRWLPLAKWLLAIPHYIVLTILGILAAFAVIIAWFAILFTGNYPRGLFNFVVGVMRWSLRVQAYAFLLVTDRYPPFSLE